MFIKKKFLYIVLILCSFSLSSISWAMDDDINLDDFDATTISLDAIEEYEAQQITGGGTRAPVPLGPTANILCQILKQPQALWQNTKPPRGRDVLYLLPHKITTLEYGGLGISAFFNMTNKMHVGASSLINFSNIDRASLLAAIQLAAVNPGTFQAQHLDRLIDIFKNFNIQDRKTGFFLQGGFIKGPFTLQMQTSIHLAAKNFFLNEKEQAESKELFGLIDPAWKEAQLSKKEFYILKYGMGDTRIKAGLNSLNKTNLQVDTGFEFILPTSRFVSQPVSNILLSPNTLGSAERAQLDSILPQILRHNIRDLLLQPPLGNGGHFGVGWYIESKVEVPNYKSHLWFRFSYDNLLSREQKRLIMYKPTINNLADFSASLIGMGDPELIGAISQLLREFYFPTPFDIEDHPGGVVNFVTSFNTTVFKKWKIALGYDFLHQQKGRIKALYNTGVTMQELNIEGAETSARSQHKIFGEVMQTKSVTLFGIKTNLDMALGGDCTTKSKNLGYDWTLYLKFATSF